MFEKFQFRKFEPTEDLVDYSGLVLTQITDIAPSDSYCTAIMTKVGDEYECSINIASMVGYFKAKSRNRDPKLALDLLEEKISANIRAWKKTRRKKSSNDDWFSSNSFGGELMYA